MPEGLTDEVIKVTLEIQPDKPDQHLSPSIRFFIDTSGDWREVIHDGSWWVVGHHLMYPARDRDDAQRLRNELSHRHKSS